MSKEDCTFEEVVELSEKIWGELDLSVLASKGYALDGFELDEMYFGSKREDPEDNITIIQSVCMDRAGVEVFGHVEHDDLITELFGM
jgi:hypothetical protein